jgi:hypothetical protein
MVRRIRRRNYNTGVQSRGIYTAEEKKMCPDVYELLLFICTRGPLPRPSSLEKAVSLEEA